MGELLINCYSIRIEKVNVKIIGLGAGAPDPLRSSSGTSTGLPSQSQSSSGIPSISAGSGSGYDAYGRPIDVPSTGGGGYTTDGK